MLIRLILFAAICLVCGCMQTRQTVKPSLVSEGELFLYIEPLPQDTARLQFTIESVSAVREDGMEVPLKPKFVELSLAEVQRQRLFAGGILQPGRYKGIAIKLKNALLTGEEGKGRLLVPEQSYENSALFSVADGKATVVTMGLNYRKAMADEITFSPVFTATVPPAPLPELTGYMTNHADNTITVFDKRSARIGAMIETGKGPSGIVLDQVRMLVYVAMTGEDTVGVIDVRDNSFIDRIRLTPGDAPRFLAITPDAKLAVSANSRSNTASIIDLQSRVEVARLPVGIGAEFVLMDRGGKRAYVFNRLSNSITVIDLATRIVAGTLQTESGPLYGQFSRKGDRLFVYHEMSPNILVITLDGQAMTRRINAATGIRALKINATTDQIYVGNSFGGVIDIYDPFTLMAVDFLNADGGVGYMTIDGDENNLLVIHPRNRLLRFVNLIGKKERGLLDTGAEPYDVVIFGER